MIYFYNNGKEDNIHNPLNNIVIYSVIGVNESCLSTLQKETYHLSVKAVINI